MKIHVVTSLDFFYIWCHAVASDSYCHV